jgi:hypothetical protein
MVTRLTPVLIGLGMVVSSVVALAQGAPPVDTTLAQMPPATIATLMRQGLPLPQYVGCSAWLDAKSKIEVYEAKQMEKANELKSALFSDLSIVSDLIAWQDISRDEQVYAVEQMLKVASKVMGRVYKLSSKNIDANDNFNGTHLANGDHSEIELRFGTSAVQAISVLFHELFHGFQVDEMERAAGASVLLEERIGEDVGKVLESSAEKWATLSKQERVDVIGEAASKLNTKYPNIYFGSKVEMIMPQDIGVFHSSFSDAKRLFTTWMQEGVLKGLHPVAETFKARTRYSGGVLENDHTGKQVNWGHSPMEITLRAVEEVAERAMDEVFDNLKANNKFNEKIAAVERAIERSGLTISARDNLLHPEVSQKVGVEYLKVLEQHISLSGIAIDTSQKIDIHTLLKDLEAASKAEEGLSATKAFLRFPKTSNRRSDFSKFLHANPEYLGVVRLNSSGSIVAAPPTSSIGNALAPPKQGVYIPSELVKILGLKDAPHIDAEVLALAAKKKLGQNHPSNNGLWGVAHGIAMLYIGVEYAQKYEKPAKELQKRITIKEPPNWGDMPSDARLDVMRQMSDDIRRAKPEEFPLPTIKAPANEDLMQFTFDAAGRYIANQHVMLKDPAAKIHTFSEIAAVASDFAGLVGRLRDFKAKPKTPAPTDVSQPNATCVADIAYAKR